jgi:hypothetical protein
MASTLQVTTSRGITFTISAANVIATGLWWDNEPFVRASGAVSVLGWSPPMTGAGATTQNGGMKNPRGTIGHDQGFDARSPYDSGTLAVPLPVTLLAGDTLLAGTSGAGNGGTATVPRPGYFPERDGRSYLDYMASLSVIDYVPAADDFRPNVQGDPAQRQRVAKSSIIWSRLPAVFYAAHAHAPTIAECERVFTGYMGDILGGWTSDQIAPNFQHPGYGQWLASAVSDALAMACSDLPLPMKQPLVEKLIQAGIDLWGAFRDGRVNYSNGGHLQARKALVIFAGHMLGLESMANPDATLGVARFREQDAHYRDGVDAWQGWRQRWSYNRGVVAASTYEATAPSTWGSAEVFWEHYHGDATLGVTLGQAMVMGLIGRVREWSIDAFASCWWHMVTPTTAMLAVTSFTPQKLEYWQTVPLAGGGTLGPQYKTAYSHRSNGGSFFTEQWATVQLLALRPYVSFVGAISSSQVTCVTFDIPTYGAAFTFECTNAPLGVPARVWYGSTQVKRPTTDATIWAAATAVANAPNAYGYHRNTITFPAVTSAAAAEARWELVVIYDMGGGNYQVTPTMQLYLAVPYADVIP